MPSRRRKSIFLTNYYTHFYYRLYNNRLYNNLFPSFFLFFLVIFNNYAKIIEITLNTKILNVQVFLTTIALTLASRGFFQSERDNLKYSHLFYWGRGERWGGYLGTKYYNLLPPSSQHPFWFAFP